MSVWFQRFGFAIVGDGFLSGAMPVDAPDVQMLRRAQVDVAYNMCEDDEYEGPRAGIELALANAGIVERRAPTADYGGLSPALLDSLVGGIDADLEAGRRVYLHCRAGWQRSAAVAAPVIALRENLDLEEALDVLQERKPSADPLEHQWEDVRAWWAARQAPAGREPGH
jgi:protein-tyrosine phosphatase